MEPAASHTQKRPLFAFTSLAVVSLRSHAPSSTRRLSRARAHVRPVRRRRLGVFVPAGVCVALALAVVFSLTAANASAVPTADQGVTLRVNSTFDMSDSNPGDGLCKTWEANLCTLRAAIMESNAHPGPDTIIFDIGGVYELEIPTLNDDTSATGDFDITRLGHHRRRRDAPSRSSTAASRPTARRSSSWAWTGSSRSIRPRPR